MYLLGMYFADASPFRYSLLFSPASYFRLWSPVLCNMPFARLSALAVVVILSALKRRAFKHDIQDDSFARAEASCTIKCLPALVSFCGSKTYWLSAIGYAGQRCKWYSSSKWEFLPGAVFYYASNGGRVSYYTQHRNTVLSENVVFLCTRPTI